MSRASKTKRIARKRRDREKRQTAERTRQHMQAQREPTPEDLEREAVRLAEAERQRRKRAEDEAREARRRADAEIDPALKWHLVEAKPQRTAQMVESLREAGVAVFRPDEEREIVLPDGRRRTIREPLLSRDVFVGLERPTYTGELEQAHWPVRRVQMRSATDAAGEPIFVPALVRPCDLGEFADRVVGLGEGVCPDTFVVGEVVRITKGPFASFVGPIEEQIADTGRWKVAVNIMGRFTPVELSQAEFEKT